MTLLQHYSLLTVHFRNTSNKIVLSDSLDLFWSHKMPFQSAFLHVHQPGSTAVYVIYRTSDIRCCREFGWVPFLYGAYSQWNDFELILTVKMETRHLIEGSFGSEFLAICNHCVVMTA